MILITGTIASSTSLVIAGMNTARGHDLLGVWEVRTVTLPGWAACRALGVPADLLGLG
jgi:hypothetical protein